MEKLLTVSCMYTDGESKDWLHELLMCFRGSPYSIRFDEGSSLPFGFPKGRLESIRKTTTKYFTYVDPDDHVDPTWYTQAVAMLEEYPALAFVAPYESNMTADGRRAFTTPHPDQKPLTTLNEYLALHTRVHGGVVYRTAVIHQYLHVLQTQQFAAIELPLKALLINNHAFIQVPRVAYWWRRRADSHSVLYKQSPDPGKGLRWLRGAEGRKWLDTHSKKDRNRCKQTS